METRQHQPVRVRVFEGQVLRELQEKVRGQVITPDQQQYDQARRPWNGYIDRHPALVVRCVDSRDVAHAIRFARSHALEIAVRGGGHSFPGYSSVDDGLVIDLSLMKDVLVDTKRQTALVSGGVKLGELIQATERYGLVTPVGTASDTGIAGLTLGGGLGYLTGKYGLSCDNVLSYTLVTADGTEIRASATENPDLYWGLRGGGGNFGVVTTFEFQLHQLKGVLGGMLVHPLTRADEALHFYRDYSESAPDEVTVFAALTTSPDGHPICGFIACYSGDPADGERVLEPLRKFGPPLADLIHPMSYAEMISVLDASTPTGRNYYDKGCTLPQLTDAVIDQFVAAGEASTSPFNLLAIQPSRGAAARVPVEATAFSARGSCYFPVMVAAWDEGRAEPHMEWARNAYAALKPYTIDESYVNFVGAEEQSNIQSIYGKNYKRLLDLKRRYDPDNVFRRNGNIKP